MRIISPEELVDKYPCYKDMADLARSFVHKIVLCQEGNNGVLRWKGSQLIRYLTSSTGVIDLNNLAIDLFKKKFSLEEYMKFYMDMGYSLSGYVEVFGQREVTEYGLSYIEHPPEGHDFDKEYWETPIEYMRKKYKNSTVF